MNRKITTHNYEGFTNWFFIAILVVFGVLFYSDSKANYSFPPAPPTPPQSTVLMHIEYSYGGGGTYKCADLKDCYVKRLNFEARGAEQYCRKITITEDGVVKWWRKYQ